jgi:hypothetical protein
MSDGLFLLVTTVCVIIAFLLMSYFVVGWVYWLLP